MKDRAILAERAAQRVLAAHPVRDGARRAVADVVGGIWVKTDQGAALRLEPDAAVAREAAGIVQTRRRKFFAGLRSLVRNLALDGSGLDRLRPAALVQSALPDMERPAMARAIARRDLAGLAAIARHFLYGLFAAWTANIVLCAALLYFLPQLVLKKGYSLDAVALVASMSAAIMLLRAVRTPMAVLLQAAGEFKALAGLGAVSGAVSLVATLALLLAFGPVVSLLGIFLGEIAVVARCASLVAGWKRAQHAPPMGALAHA